MSDYYARSAEILLVEDNSLDAELLLAFIRVMNIPARIHHVRDGTEALHFLRQEAPHENAPRPDVVLLDLNMPRMGGHELLQIVKQDPRLLEIPVLVLTTSMLQEDVERAYDCHANGFLVKPFEIGQTRDVLGALWDFWFSIVELPSRIGSSIKPLPDSGQMPFSLQDCPIQLMYVEDDPLDAEAVVEAARDLGFREPVQVVRTGEEALELLNTGRARPDALLVDLKLSGLPGIDVLRQIRLHPRVRRLQMIAFSGSAEDTDVRAAYRAHVDAFIRKPRRLADLHQVLLAIGHWYSVTQLGSGKSL
jgi:two-component system, chemotaxis family, response regulator Rcp1